MDGDDRRALVEEWFRRYNDHDLDGCYELCADDLRLAGQITAEGKEAARALDEQFFAALPDHRRRIDKILVSGDTVAVWVTFGATPIATDVPLEFEFCDVIQVRDGRISSVTILADWDAVLPKLAH